MTKKMKTRINKYIANQTKYSRRQVDELIIKGKVKVNDEKLNKNDLGLKIDEEQDKIYLDNKLLKQKQEKFIYLTLNKPRGFVCTKNRQAGQKIIYDILPKNIEVNPVGRLDKESEGLLLLTNDGELLNQLTHPKFEHEKEYIVKLKNNISDQEINKIKKQARKITRLADNELNIILTTGHKRQIRKMAETVGNKVKKLKRIRINNLKLTNLPLGKWEYISKQEI